MSSPLNRPKNQPNEVSRKENIHMQPFASASEIADSYGIFGSILTETSIGQIQYGDRYGFTKHSDGSGTLYRERQGKREAILNMSEKFLFQDTYQPSAHFPTFVLQRKENGKYQLGPYEIITANMNIARIEIQYIADTLMQVCATRKALSNLMQSCIIEPTGEKKKGIPQYELLKNPIENRFLQAFVPKQFWESQSLRFDRLAGILRNPDGKSVEKDTSTQYLRELFEDLLHKNMTQP